MSTRSHQRDRSAEISTFCVEMRLVLDGPIPERKLEDLAVLVQGAIDEGAGDEVLGVGVAGDYAAASLSVDLELVAATQAEVYAIIARIAGLLEQTCPLEFESGETHFKRADERELVPA